MRYGRAVGEVIRELELPLDGHHMVRVYADHGTGWRAWLDFMSLEHGDLRRSGILRVAGSRDELAAWATRLTDEELHRALEDAELIPVSELGRPPVEDVALR